MKENENTNLSGRRTAMVEALNKTLEIFSVYEEETFEEVMTKGIQPLADAVGLDNVVFYKLVTFEGGKRLGQIYQWGKLQGGLMPLVEELKVLPDHPVINKWISITSNNGSIRLKESEYTEDEAALLHTYGIKSILILPIFTHGKLWGIINFEDHTNDRYFDEDCADLLYSAARIYSNSIIREEMRSRAKMETALNKAAIMFLSQNEEIFEATMTMGVREIANAFNLDRFSIWRNVPMQDGLHGGQIYRWDKKSGGTTIPKKELTDMAYSKSAPRWEKILASDKTINSPVKFLPEAELLKSFGCVSILVTPIFINNIFWGFALLEDSRSERFFEDDDIDMLRSYTANTPKVLEKLRAVSAENLSDYVISVHGLKGTSAGIGAEKIREEALELENLSRAGDLRGVLAKNDKLIADAQVVVSNVKEWLDKNDIHEAKPRLKTPDKELLVKLREYCENYDIDGIEEVMSKLESAKYEEDAGLITWVRERINISKMSEVAKRLEVF